MANSKKPNPVTVNQIIGAKIRASKRNGIWQHPKLILSIVREIAPDAETHQTTIYCDDVFCDMPSVDGGNMVHGTLGIGPRVSLPPFIKKADKDKQGKMFTKATVYDASTGQYTDEEAKPVFSLLKDGHRVECEFADADRAEVKLRAEFNLVKKYATRVLMTEDKTADGGWRQATPWTSRYCRQVEVNGTIIDAPVVYHSKIPTSEILLDRNPHQLEPAMKADSLGEML